jgi:hypothetical protein
MTIVSWHSVESGHCPQRLRSTVALGKDRSILVATVSTDDEAFYDFKVQVRNYWHHAVLELENAGEMRLQQG